MSVFLSSVLAQYPEELHSYLTNQAQKFIFSASIRVCVCVCVWMGM